MAVNDELAALRDGISRIFRLLSNGGRLAVISFHSGEDRIVKQFFQKQAKRDRGEPTSNSPITPKGSEIDINPRSRSAKLRVIEKL
jgi:16S rRNA (cytosine1402-N4)-methyltransferase